MTTNDVSDTKISTEHAQGLADRDWWQKVGDIIGLELRGWTYRSGATFVDRDTGRNVELPGSVAERILASRHPQPVNEPVTEGSFQMLMDAYIRGNQWAHENGLNADGLNKAAYDYADKTTASLSAKPTGEE